MTKTRASADSHSVTGSLAPRPLDVPSRHRRPSPDPGSGVAAATCVLVALTLPTTLAAQEGHREDRDHSHEVSHEGHHEGLHFTHPLVTESISPDTKLRLDHRFFEFPDGERENSGVLEAEYAFSRSFSIEAGMPYSYSVTEPGNLEILLKFANYAFEEAGLLLGYGVEFGFPTNGTPEDEEEEEPSVTRSPRAGPLAGEGGAAGPTARRRSSVPAPRFTGGGAGVEAVLGTDEWEVAPFLNLGWKGGAWELVAWGIFGIPFNQEEQEEVGTEISYNLSAMYHASSRVQALLELDGSGGISGEPVGEDVVNLSPGLRVRVLPDRPLVLGTSVGVPLTEESGFDVRWKTSLFWHF